MITMVYNFLIPSLLIATVCTSHLRLVYSNVYSNVLYSFSKNINKRPGKGIHTYCTTVGKNLLYSGTINPFANCMFLTKRGRRTNARTHARTQPASLKAYTRERKIFEVSSTPEYFSARRTRVDIVSRVAKKPAGNERLERVGGKNRQTRRLSLSSWRKIFRSTCNSQQSADGVAGRIARKWTTRVSKYNR